MNNINTKDNAKVAFSIVNIVIYLLMFMTTLIFFYQRINYYLYGFSIFVLVYFVLFLIFAQLFGAFNIGETRVVDLVLSHSLAFFITNCFTYVIICLIAFAILSPLPIIILQIAEMGVSTLLQFYENRYIRDAYPVLKAIAIVGEEHYDILSKIYKYRDILVDVVKRYDAKEVDFNHLDEILEGVDRVITVDITHNEKKKVFKACYDKLIRVYDIPSITDVLFASSDIMHVVDTPILKVNKFGPTPYEAIVKRLIDIVGSLVLLILASPVMLITAVAIKVYDKGDILYKQTRLTKGSKEFKIYKFRSMIMNAEAKTGVVLAKKEDDRITPVGKFIRKTRIDELPQLINVLKGDMSFVGPRPERPEIYEKEIVKMPEFKFRLVVKAGLTGYAQIYGKYNTTLKDKLLLDIYYIEKYSLIDDIKLILMTFKVIFEAESTEGIKN